MPSTYSKRIWKHPNSAYQISIYVQVVDSVAKSWNVTMNRVPRQNFTSLPAAIAFAERLPLEDPTEFHTDQTFFKLAEELDDLKPWSESLDVRLLACLYCRGLNDETEKRRYLMVANLATACGPIPTTDYAFQEWLQRAIAAVQSRRTHEIKTKRGLASRVDTLSRILKQILLFPVAFKKWVQLVQTALPRLKLAKRSKGTELESLSSYQPFSKAEISQVFDDCKTFEQATLVVIYLTSGLRSGEAEKLNMSHLIKGKSLNLAAVVTKTKTKRSPEASVALRLALQFREAGSGLPDNTQKKRFRPTCAVNLIQAGVPPLLVMERLGHASLTMLLNHYSKVVPSDWGNAKGSAGYLGVGELKIGSWSCEENNWDKFCLKLLFQQAVRFEKLEEVKEVLQGIVGEHKVLQEQVDSF